MSHFTTRLQVITMVALAFLPIALTTSALVARAYTLAPGSHIKDLSGATGWLNSQPLALSKLRGKVVAIDFYTSRCSNCMAAVPHVVKLYDKYRKQGLVVVGVHTPEMESERQLATVEATAKQLGISYPIAIDNKNAVWNAYQNQYWPNILIFDKSGKLVYEHAGEGNYDEIDGVVRGLL